MYEPKTPTRDWETVSGTGGEGSRLDLRRSGYEGNLAAGGVGMRCLTIQS